MRENEFRRMQEAMQSGQSLTAALGLQLPFATSLSDFLAEELGAEGSLGLPWLSADAVAVRILCSDYIASSASSSVRNMMQARLHLLEVVEAFDLLDSTARYTTALTPKMPSGPQSAEQALATAKVEINSAGLLRAIGSALDCMGIAIIGLSALPYDLQRGSFAMARRLLGDHAEEMPTDLPLKVEEAVVKAGPRGWLQWTLDMRNALVHRPLRMQMWHAPNMGQTRRRRVLLLPRQPRRSDIEAFRDARSPEAALLHENAEDVLAGVVTSAQALIDQVAAELHKLALLRKREPGILKQPPSQWSRKAYERASFTGYGVEKVQIAQGSQILMHPATGKRLRAASVMGREDLWHWSGFWDTPN